MTSEMKHPDCCCQVPYMKYKTITGHASCCPSHKKGGIAHALIVLENDYFKERNWAIKDAYTRDIAYGGEGIKLDYDDFPSFEEHLQEMLKEQNCTDFYEWFEKKENKWAGEMSFREEE